MEKQLALWAATPIPPQSAEAPRREPQESGEPLVRMNDLHPRIRFLASYHGQNIPGANTELYLRNLVSEKLCQAADLLPADSLYPFNDMEAYVQLVKSKKAGAVEYETEQLSQKIAIEENMVIYKKPLIR